MIASDRTMKNRKMIISCAGVDPAAGKLILMRPEKPAPFVLLMSSWASLGSNPHAFESMTRVNRPVALLTLVIVNGIALGGGV